MLNILKTIATRELTIAYRNNSSWAYSVLFIIIICSIAPIIIQNNVEFLIKLAPLMIWLAFLLGILLSLDSMFKADFALGTFEEFYLSPYPLSWLFFIKVITQLLIITIPVLITLPIILVAYHLNFTQISVLFLTIIIGAPALVFIGAICAAMTAGLPRGGILLLILSLPLYLPVLILACISFFYFIEGYDMRAPLALLLALSIISILIAPFLGASILRTGIQCGN